MTEQNWRASGVGLGLVFGAGIGIISSLLLGFELVYGIAAGAAFGYLIGLVVSLTGKT
ncbi:MULTISPECIES: hypothetical protein [Exiguobacterium]|uniref:Glycine zipper family protein n=1 Tax=Exiguobacterium chiriqhucha RW-2 TaxID=1345023 RepID=U1LZV9_9BACL|nr:MULTISPECIES: hypothetical protein [Exiguobacterium]ERG67942.1 hypothetical protein M467_11670 [Exiguobacterium chiriqhucha RW-2]